MRSWSEQIGALVGGKAPGEPDGQCIATEHAPQLCDDTRWLTLTLRLQHETPADLGDQPGLQRQMRLPQLPIVDVVDRFPEGGVGAAGNPVGAEMTFVDEAHLGREP